MSRGSDHHHGGGGWLLLVVLAWFVVLWVIRDEEERVEAACPTLGGHVFEQIGLTPDLCLTPDGRIIEIEP